MKPTCDCIAQLEAKMAERNTKFLRAITFGETEVGTSLIISTELIEKKRGARPLVAFPSFCPFCGLKYQASTKQTA